MPYVCVTADDDAHVKAKDMEVVNAEVDADCSRNSEEPYGATDASDEGPSLQEQAHVTLPEEAGEEEVEFSMFLC